MNHLLKINFLILSVVEDEKSRKLSLFVLFLLIILSIAFVATYLRNKSNSRKNVILDRQRIIAHAISLGGIITITDAYQVSHLENDKVKELIERFVAEGICTAEICNDGNVYYKFISAAKLNLDNIECNKKEE